MKRGKSNRKFTKAQVTKRMNRPVKLAKAESGYLFIEALLQKALKVNKV
jgi:hypothetical protein